MIKSIIKNQALTNLTFVLVLFLGALAYIQLPREQDPSIDFNWVIIATKLPGASAEEVEREVTEPLEEAIARVSDVRHVSSNSRQDISSILVRFADLDDDRFATRLTDLRREIQNKSEELPDAAHQPDMVEINTGNAFPTALVLVTGHADDEGLRRQARIVKEDIKRLPGVDRADSAGENDPELQVLFYPERLVGLGIQPTDLSDTVSAYFRNLAAGSVHVGDKKWQVQLEGAVSDPEYLANLPIITAQGEVPLDSVAEVVRGRADALHLARHQDRPAVLIYVSKKPNANLIEVVEDIKTYIATRNELTHRTGVELVLLDDRTAVIEESLEVMQTNAFLGLILVLLVTGAFLGFKIAFLTSIGIPFVLAGTFLVLYALGFSLNVVVLLGIVISLGMLVDDTVVVVEAIYVQMRQGLDAIAAVHRALQEVAVPVTTAVLTTIAAFLPLMLMPGILGKFMFVAPLVVSTALLISLIEAFWLLPGHIVGAKLGQVRPTKTERIRQRVTGSIRKRYTRFLISVLRHPVRSASLAIFPFLFAVVAVLVGVVRTEFFASDPYRFFYVNVTMPPGTTLHETMEATAAVERKVRENLPPTDIQVIASYAGRQFSETEPFIGDRYGQVFVNLSPAEEASRSIDTMVAELRDEVLRVPGPEEVSFLRRSAGPPTSKPISIKIRGDTPSEIRRAADRIVTILSDIPAVSDIVDDDTEGRMELRLRLNPDTLTRSGLDPTDVIRTLRLFSGGEIAASTRFEGDRLEVRVRAKQRDLEAIDSLLQNTIGTADGEIAIGQLVTYETIRSTANIRHYNFRRAITIEANLDKSIMDTVEVNRLIETKWAEITDQSPNVTLDFSGELDDIQESLNAIFFLFLLGVGLIFLILGTQFNSYLQPLFVLVTVPMAFTGVVLGLLISGHPLSMYTLYGIVALAGIAVNDAIVLISTANRYRRNGMSIIHATVYAAKRRVTPVLITTTTTMAGLFSLAFGLGGESLIWGPVATAIFWGLAVSTALTLTLIPLGYAQLAYARKPQSDKLQIPSPLPHFRWHPRRLLTALRYGLNPRGTTEPWRWGAADPALHDMIDEGLSHLRDEDFDNAIRTLEEAARRDSSSAKCQLFAAQALIMHMQKHGFDIGYFERARRYLARAETIAPGNPRLEKLRRAFSELEGELTTT